MIYFAGTLYWVIGVMNTYGGLAMPVAVLVAALLAFYLALYPACFALLLGRAVRRFGPGGVWLAPLLWVATEWLRATVGGGFPWALLGSSQALVVPVVQLASLVGVYGLSAFVALVSTTAAAVALSDVRRQRLAVGVVAALVIVVTTWGTVRAARGTLLTAGRPLRVGLVQGSVEQVDKYDTRFRDGIIRRYLDLSQRALSAGSQIVIWPESSTPFYFDANSVLAEPVRQLAADSHTPFIIGSDEVVQPPSGAEPEFYNSAVLLGADGRSHGTYRKMRLVPFGEYVPLKRLLFFVAPLIQTVGDFSPGTTPVVFDAGVGRLSVAICYESVYPWIGREFVEGGSELLAIITNDAWFSTSSAAYQHFEQGALRGIEEGRYVVRAANTGISGAVDPYGHVLARTDLFEPTALAVDVRLLDDRTVYSRIGDVMAWIGLAVAAVVLVPARRRTLAPR